MGVGVGSRGGDEWELIDHKFANKTVFSAHYLDSNSMVKPLVELVDTS